MDADMMAAMGISGFGKQSKKHELKPDRFDKAKRTDVRSSSSSSCIIIDLSDYRQIMKRPKRLA